jgi:hypothetical protein
VTRRGTVVRVCLALLVFALFLAGLALTTGCTLKAAADCMARPDAPCEGDDQVRDMDPAAIPDARRLHPQQET